jgi:anti-sigma B factor antagonist
LIGDQFEDEPQIEVEPDLAGRVVVIVHGSLDLHEVGRFRAVMTEICAGDAPAVVIDLTDVTFIGSSGLGVIVQARQDLDGLGRRLIVRGASAPIRKTFEITQLDHVLEMEDGPGPVADPA